MRHREFSSMSFHEFLQAFIPTVQKKSKQLRQAEWILETTGSRDAADLKAELEIELRLLFNDKAVFEQLVMWDLDPTIADSLLKRQLNVLIRTFKPNLISKELLEKIAHAEAHLSLLYSNFRPQCHGKTLSENDIRDILKNENDVQLRKSAWEASKQIGKVLAPHILQLVNLRNAAAKSLGYADYFCMQLELQEVDQKWLLRLLENVAERSEEAYLHIIDEINAGAAKRLHVPSHAIGPWAWSEPFCQEDPIDVQALDGLVTGIDLLASAKHFFQIMGFDVEKILNRSDNFERPGKNQHAFCTHIDRKGDVRMLNNIKPSIKWLETILHELGHGVYELGFAPELPWLLKEPPHMITTEAMALLMGRQAYRAKPLEQLVQHPDGNLKAQAEISLRRRQLIFSRWVLVMTYFERELYRNPQQDLNRLWWEMVGRFQKIKCTGSLSQCDWAAKYHMGLAPVYYFSYLLGELLASSLEVQTPIFPSKQAGAFLNEQLFKPGNRLDWSTLIQHATGKELTAEAWLAQFASAIL